MTAPIVVIYDGSNVAYRPKADIALSVYISDGQLRSKPFLAQFLNARYSDTA
jgi:hypothetical protein